jgi:hypothetical protein
MNEIGTAERQGELSAKAMLTRQQTAVALREAGYPVAVATLASKATRGGGPPFRMFGSKPLYMWGDALAWAVSRTSGPVNSTAEAQHLRATAA